MRCASLWTSPGANTIGFGTISSDQLFQVFFSTFENTPTEVERSVLLFLTIIYCSVAEVKVLRKGL